MLARTSSSKSMQRLVTTLLDGRNRMVRHHLASSLMGMWRAAGLTLGLLVLTAPPSVVEAGKGVGEDAAYAREMGMEQRFFYVAAGDGIGQIQYICRSFPGTTGSDDVNDDVWQVQRFTYDSSNRLSTIAYAGDDDAYNQICANRATLNYD